MLADPARRGILFAMARGGAQPATILKSSAGKRLDAALKHLTALRKSGIATAAPDPTDGRRTLYGLSPNVTVVKSAEGTSLDFGCCVVRL
jgi:DNA-binding transcriptional ArsR family regulator